MDCPEIWTKTWELALKQGNQYKSEKPDESGNSDKTQMYSKEGILINRSGSYYIMPT